MNPVDQKKCAHVAQLLAARPEVFAAQGSVAVSWRTYRGRRLGPYYRLAYRQAGRQCAVYLGRSQQLAEQVAALLAAAQQQRQRRRGWQRLRRRARAQLRAHKRQWELRLCALGLRAKGFEIRGGSLGAPARGPTLKDDKARKAKQS